MAPMPIFSVQGFHARGETRDCACACIPDEALPLCYMADFSILGLLVEDLPKALEVLSERGLVLSEGTNPESPCVESRKVKEILQVLHQERLACEIADIVREIYQG
jgi:hypothetical protein